MKTTNETMLGNYQLSWSYAARYYSRAAFMRECGTAVECGRERKAYLVPGTAEAGEWAQLSADIESLARGLAGGEQVAYVVYRALADEEDGTFTRFRVGDLCAHKEVNGWGLVALCRQVYGLDQRDGICFFRLGEKVKRRGAASKAALDSRWEQVRETAEREHA